MAVDLRCPIAKTISVKTQKTQRKRTVEIVEKKTLKTQGVTMMKKTLSNLHHLSHFNNDCLILL